MNEPLELEMLDSLETRSKQFKDFHLQVLCLLKRAQVWVRRGIDPRHIFELFDEAMCLVRDHRLDQLRDSIYMSRALIHQHYGMSCPVTLLYY